MWREEPARGRRVDDHGDLVVLAELLDQALESPTGPAGACWLLHGAGDVDQEDEVAGGPLDWSIGLAAMPIRARRCDAFQGQPTTSTWTAKDRRWLGKGVRRDTGSSSGAPRCARHPGAGAGSG